MKVCSSCRTRLKKQSPAEAKGKSGWTKEQDGYLSSLNGGFNWEVITAHINFLFPHCPKTPEDCYKRWQSLMAAPESKTPWSAREDVMLLAAHNRYRNKWTEVSNLLRGRCNSMVKNRFYTIFRRIKGKIVKFNCTYSSKIELLETYYVISLIEDHLAHPPPNPAVKGKRGTDFIYSLVHDLSLQRVLAYKEQMERLAKQEGDMSKLFRELSSEYKISINDREIKEEDKVITTASAERKAEAEAKGFKENTEGLELKLPSAREVNHANREVVKKTLETVYERTEKPSCTRMPSKTLGENWSTPFDVPEHDSVLPSEMEYISPGYSFSPLPLSAGPAAAAGRAFSAACFKGEGFTDISQLVIKVKKESTIAQLSAFTEKLDNYTQRNSF